MKYKLFLSLIPFFSSCQNEKIDVINFDENSIKIEAPCYQFQYYRNSIGDHYVNGVGFVDADEELVVIKKNNNVSTFKFPIPIMNNFYGISRKYNDSIYYYLDANRGLFQLFNDKAPIFIDSVQNDETLDKNGLMIFHMLSAEKNIYSLNSDQLLIPITWDYFNPNTNFKKIAKKPCPSLAKYTISTKKMEVLAIFSDDRMYRLNYGSNRAFEPFFCYSKDKIIISNAINPNVEIFDIKSNKIVGNELVKSTFQTDSIVPYKKKKNYDKDRYSIESGCYGPIYYNELRHEYYRVFYHALPQKNEKNEFTIYEDKSSSILVLDEDLKLKKEVFFKKGYFHFFGITGTENGFLLNQINGDGKNCFFVEINLKNKS